MNITDDILQAVSIALVTIFLLNTGRAVKAIEICKEALILLNIKEVKVEGKILNLLYIGIYRTIFRVYCLFPDHTQA